MKWLRLYHDTPNDPKWRLVAAESGQCEGLVLAVWMHMMVCASSAEDRGRLEGWDDRVVAASMGVKAAVVTDIREAMQGVVLDGDVLTGWDKRQRVSDDVAERKRRERAQKTAPDGGGGGGHATDCDKPMANGHVTRHEDSVTRQSGNVTRHSQEGHATKSNVAGNPLYLSYLPTPTLIKDGGGGAGGRAHEVGEYVAARAGLKVQACIDRAAKWIAAGFDVHADIIPTVDDLVKSAKEPIGTPQYFDKAIARHYAARTAPLPQPLPPNVSYLSGAGGRQAKEDPAITRLKQRFAEEQGQSDERGVL